MALHYSGNSKLIFILSILFLCNGAVAQYSITGKVLNSNNKPIEFAVVSIANTSNWATANARGEFLIKNITSGKLRLSIGYLGYVKKDIVLTINKDTVLNIFLEEDNLALKEVQIAAKKSSNLSTSYIIDKTALEHLQALSLIDITSLLPGRKTNTSEHLATSGSQRLEINGFSGEKGNATFGVALEVDGVRISNNSARDLNNSGATNPVAGPDTKNISTSNIESVEVVTGIPSVEYGDMTNGLVKINTRKGVSPYILELSTRPNSKLISLSKGINLKDRFGVINYSLEHTNSISDLASPYTAYDRNSLTLNYANTFNKQNKKPINVNFGITGNLGGYNSEADPDFASNTYSKITDNAVRTNFSFNWLLNSPWITNISASANLNYNAKLRETSINESSSASKVSIRTTEEGYHIGDTYENNPEAPIILIPPGYWYEIAYNDNKILNYNALLKANWSKKFGQITSNLKIGADFNRSENNGNGTYYNDPRYTPTWRPYSYKDESAINNYAFFAEDILNIPVNNSELQIQAGLRSEITDINGSEYGVISNWSPRFNAKYIFWEKQEKTVSDFSVQVGWGKTVKLPGFDALYATPSYRDIRTFSPGTTSSGETYYAYYTIPVQRNFNPDLKWQTNEQKELTLSLNIGGNRISINASRDKTLNPYIYSTDYTPFYYKFTDQSALESSSIPAENRIYTVDPYTGVVTVTDKTGLNPTETLFYTSTYTFVSKGKYTNGSPVYRNRINWIVDFKQIQSIKTSVRVDGSYYHYKGLEKTVSAYMPNATQTMADGNPYKYIGYYIGGANVANGDISRSLNTNFTITTHIPAIRLILSARLECSFYNFSRRLSESSSGQRGFVLENKEAYEASATITDIYGGDRFVAVYPEYYVSLDDLNTKIPFAEKFLWAKENDTALYNELSRMVIKTNYNYYFNKSRISDYYSANIAVTKEIGSYASLSFFANNFFVNMGKVKSALANTEYSLYNSSTIPKLYYGATLKLKL